MEWECGSRGSEGVRAGGSGSVEVEGVGVEEGGDECGLPFTSEDAGTVAKRRRLSAMADEPVQSWLDNLPRDDLQHIALLLYGRLPTVFGLTKTAVVGEVLQKNERTIRHWVDDFGWMTFSNGGESSDSQQGHYSTLMSNEEL